MLVNWEFSRDIEVELFKREFLLKFWLVEEIVNVFIEGR